MFAAESIHAPRPARARNSIAHLATLFAPLLLAATGFASAAAAQSQTNPAQGDTTTRLATVKVTATKTPRTVGRLPEVSAADGRIYSGKKTEVITLDSLAANTVQNVSRQILGRVPGATFSETEGSGFPSNGIGFRGLDPTQSAEVNTRQNGINIAADLYGYPETYYTPPMEAIERIEVVRGASSLQFGPQFGGVVNYITRQGALNTRPTFATQNSTGSFGLFSSFNSLGGGTDRTTYYGYVQYRAQDGWRPNSDVRQVSAYGTVGFRASDRVKLTGEYSLLRNRIQMPGGLSDAQYAASDQQSFRARNWLATPWNILTGKAEVQLSPSATWVTNASYMFSQRYLVWRDEDGGPQAPDEVDPSTGTYSVREVDRERFNNFTTESRVLLDYSLLGTRNTLGTGVRLFTGDMGRKHDGPGSTGSDFDMKLYGGPFGSQLRFGTANASAYAENLIRVSDRLSVTPGVRYEYLYSTVRGVSDTTFSPQQKTRSFALFGTGAQYALSPSTSLYANVSQAYRPITYDALTPFASVSRIDPNLKDARGYNADLGWRGTVPGLLTFDVSGFYLRYNDRVGTFSANDASGATYTEVTNIANSVHRGVEAYVELAPAALFGAAASRSTAIGSFRLFDSFAYVDARYVSGKFNGNRVEQAPRIVNRTGATYELGAASLSLQVSQTARSYSDANNTVASEDAVIGVVPAYQVLDLSGSYRLSSRLGFKFGVNNLADRRYFTKRAAEYPGPGIIPGIGRSAYFTFTAGTR